MLRYISEHKVSPQGTKLTVPAGSLFKSVHKVSNYFVVVVEVFAETTAPRTEVEIVIKKCNTYIHQKAKFISSVLVGDTLFHFYAQPVGVDDGQESIGLTRQDDPSSPPPSEV